MVFRVWRLRFDFLALDPLRFPPSGAANTLRGAFGLALRRTASPGLYTRIFEPPPAASSGLARPPRPFVFRARDCAAGAAPGATWHFTINLFETSGALIDPIAAAVEEMARAGLGAGRGRSGMVGRESALWSVNLAQNTPVERVLVRFLTPFELKTEGKVASKASFSTLFARLRDRIANLSALYAGAPLDIDFAAMGRRAAEVRTAECRLDHAFAARRSTRTLETHPLGGFTGVAIYEGALGEFVPYLRAAEHTGVGRQAVWGKGEIAVEVVATGCERRA